MERRREKVRGVHMTDMWEKNRVCANKRKKRVSECPYHFRICWKIVIRRHSFHHLPHHHTWVTHSKKVSGKEREWLTSHALHTPHLRNTKLNISPNQFVVVFADICLYMCVVCVCRVCECASTIRPNIGSFAELVLLDYLNSRPTDLCVCQREHLWVGVW